MLRTPSPGTYETLLEPVSVPVAKMWRLSKFASTEPYWSKRMAYRFDDPDARVSSRFGVLYVAQDLETAFCESIIHENALFKNGAFEVPLADLDSRELTCFKHSAKTELVLADLTGAALKSLGLNNDISAGDDYDIPQQWARAIYVARVDMDGIRFMSRQNNGSYCYAVFERSGLIVDSWAPLPTSSKSALCKKYNVSPV